MALLQHAPRFEAGMAAQIARDLYGVEATASPLPSERDQNFLLETPSRDRFVLKIANGAEDRGQLEAQNAAMEHVASLGLCPRVVHTTGGQLIGCTAGGYFVRLLTWLGGIPLGTVPRHSPELLEDVGRRLGELDAALTAFDHPAVHRDFHWDLANGFRIVREHAARVPDAALRALVRRVAEEVERRDSALLRRLRRSAIHGDANDYNVLVSDNPEDAAARQRVVGLVDFGDLVYSYTIADLAIAIAYGVIDKPDPLYAALPIVRGYHGTRPILDDELAALFGLVQLRLCVSICLAAHQQPERPSDEYLSVSQAPIRRTLPALAAIHLDVAEAAFRSACRGGEAGVDATKDETLARRGWRIGANVRVAYRDPVKVVRGSMQYLFDEDGRRYLDAYNNVPHVGHCHPRVVEAGATQMRVLNANTRYLNDLLWQFADRLCTTLPSPLRVCYFVNSGSEANELALRIARAHTHRRDLIVLESAYHGNTTTLIDISPYKFNGPGGEGSPLWVHTAPSPDVYRGRWKADADSAGEKYAAAVGEIVDDLRRRGAGPAGFIAETCPSVGGQIIPPRGYLRAVYQHVRDAGGVCIADEVQTAYGRMGSHFYAFEAQDVVPDIVVLGKPIGNGHPIGAVITTAEIAASFDNGMEFFSTFGGNTVSCAIGVAVLQVVQDEGLEAHALCVGEHMLAGLRSLALRHRMIGDVRGSGLFLGVELVQDRATLVPATDEASTVVNRMREEGILLGTDGPLHNVLKIRPPMPFNNEDADLLVSTLDRVLSEIEK